MQEVLDFAESQFQNNQKNYSVIVFGIAAYEKVKEHFGLEAAKRVMATLGRLLKRYSNESDLIAYYGEERVFGLFARTFQRGGNRIYPQFRFHSEPKYFYVSANAH